MKHGRWSFFSNHLHVLECLLRSPDITLREVSEQVGISLRAVQGIVSDLVEDGYLSRKRVGRRNAYVVHLDASLRHEINAQVTLRHVVSALVQPPGQATSSGSQASERSSHPSISRPKLR
ncbi:MAG: winged helix-turn-helix domain-containing protein [Chloroflexi bacterium]|nr:winged helix-turn-helix domain-containing protein [Chloroflexota bacterium]